MPLSVNVGLSRKASKDYQSTGYSINVTAELDQSLLARPEELQLQIDALYQQAEAALSKQAGEPQQGQERQRPAYQGRRQYQQRPQEAQQTKGYSNGKGGQHSNRYSNGNDDGGGQSSTNGRNGNANGRGTVASMTVSQRKAILAIAARIQADAEAESRDIIGVELDNLSISQASELIDHLKALQNSDSSHASGSGSGRDRGVR